MLSDLKKIKKSLYWKGYYQRNKDRLILKQRKYYQDTKEARLLWTKKYRKDNKEDISRRRKIIYNNNYQKNKHKLNEYKKLHRKNNREKYLEYDRKRYYRDHGNMLLKKKKYRSTHMAQIQEYRHKNKDRLSALSKEYRKNNPEKMMALRERWYKKNYNMTLSQKIEMIKTQDGKCAICKTDFSKIGVRGSKSPDIDHDHRTGKIRKILCNMCNRGIGHFNDDPSLLRSAAEYLDFYRKTT